MEPFGIGTGRSRMRTCILSDISYIVVLNPNMRYVYEFYQETFQTLHQIPVGVFPLYLLRGLMTTSS